MRFVYFNCLIFLFSFFFDSQSLHSENDDSLPRTQSLVYRIADKPFFTISREKQLSISNVKLIPTSIFVGTYGIIFYLQHLGQKKTIWKNFSNFQVVEDGKYALYADKAGHFYGTFLTSYILLSSLIECGFDYHLSSAIGSVLGLAYTTYVEVLDGFSKDWGFSPSDFYADLAGAFFFLGYAYFPLVQNFTPKFMYTPPRWINSNSRVPSSMFIDDYSSHTFFISVNIYNILPQHLKKYYPSWLEFSFGYAVRNLCDPFHYSCSPNSSEPISPFAWGNRKFIIALDYDLVKLLPDGKPFWNWFKQSLNFFKFPSPAIEFGSPTRFYLLYPFPIKIGNVKF